MKSSTIRGLGDRRLERRRSLQARVFVVPMELEQMPFPAFTEDLSLLGVFLTAQRRLPLGTRCVLQLAPEQRGHTWVKAKVVHLIEGVGFGCRFEPLEVKTRETLSGWLDPAQSPPRPARPASRYTRTMHGY